MRILIAYSSKTGNTRKIAEAIYDVMPESSVLAPIKDNPDTSLFDVVFLGFWARRGGPDTAMREYMKNISGKKIGLFGTLGAWPDSDHSKKVMNTAIELMNTNIILGTFLCQGKIAPELTEKMSPRLREKHPMTEERKRRHAEAKKHPDSTDCLNAQKWFQKMIVEYQNMMIASEKIEM